MPMLLIPVAVATGTKLTPLVAKWLLRLMTAGMVVEAGRLTLTEIKRGGVVSRPPLDSTQTQPE